MMSGRSPSSASSRVGPELLLVVSLAACRSDRSIHDAGANPSMASATVGCTAANPPATARIVLQRRETPIGGGRAYTVELHPDGSVIYEGDANVRVRGSARWAIPRADAESLFAQAACANPGSWKSRYDIGTDDVRALVTLDLGGSGRFVIENNAGCPPSAMLVNQAPAALCDLEQAIDATAGARAYTDCRSDDGGWQYCGP